MERNNHLAILLALAVAVTAPIESTVCPEHKLEDVHYELELELPEPQATVVCI